MDPVRFDILVMSLSASGTRRGIVRLLGALPLVGVLTTILADESEAAKRRRTSRGRRNGQQHDRLHDQGKRHKKKGKGISPNRMSSLQ